MSPRQSLADRHLRWRGIRSVFLHEFHPPIWLWILVMAPFCWLILLVGTIVAWPWRPPNMPAIMVGWAVAIAIFLAWSFRPVRLPKHREPPDEGPGGAPVEAFLVPLAPIRGGQEDAWPIDGESRKVG